MKKFFVVMLLGLNALVAHADQFTAGKDYEVLKPGLSQPASEEKIMVLDFFSYGCPWCYKLNKPLEQWADKQGKDIKLQKVPVVFHAEWQLYAKAFYAAELLGIEDKMTPLLFAAIQEKNTKLDTPAAMRDFFIKHGVDKETALSAFNHSPTLDLKLKNGLKKMGRYQVKAVPAVVIGGRYKTDLRIAQSPERFFAIIDFLLARVETERNTTS